ncbi:MAG TPA: flavodoxin domain-containing protein [Patescibacteria group bacterium]|nr:flavodoxin domain-containing protein [Patescibacteria group bacterium]
MKTLIVYYSRTGNTRKLAKKLSKSLNAQVEEIIDKKKRKGFWGYILSGKQAGKREKTEIEKIKNNPKNYDLILIGTPIWAWNICPAVRTYLNEQKDNLPDVAFFCTMGGTGDKKAFSEMEKICQKEPSAKLSFTEKELKKSDQVKTKITDFIQSFKK